MTRRRGIRLSAGVHKGRVLSVPAGVRPTEGRVREALFDILGPGPAGHSFLDLFAGSGAVGIEAASRGAGRVLQVDRDARVVSGLEATYSRHGVSGVACRRLELPDGLAKLAPERFDRVFADPPYDFRLYDELVAALGLVLAPEATAVVEHEDHREPAPRAGGVECFDRRRYGGTVLSFYRLSAAD